MSNNAGDWLKGLVRLLMDWVRKVWRSYHPSTHIDDYPVEEARMEEISRRVPDTMWGRELLTTFWPTQYQDGLTSETYLGCLAALQTLAVHLQHGMTLSQIEQKVNAVDESLKSSKFFLPNTHRTGGAALVLTNASNRTRSGLSAYQVLVALDSELIYAAKMFVAARQREKAGESLQ